MNEPQTFPIGHLRDIYKLPTDEQVVTCLDELKTLILSARAQDAAIVAVLAENGIPVTAALEWPETVNWIDDGKGDIATRIRMPDGEILDTAAAH